MSVIVVGALNVDQISYCSKIPAAGETIMGNKYETGLGGKGANQAVQCALLGTSTVMIGAVGNDANGKWYLENLPKSGVDCSKVVVLPGESTGVAPITVAESNGENSIIVISGANMGLDKTHFDLEMFKKAKIVVCQNEITHQTNKARFKYSISNTSLGFISFETYVRIRLSWVNKWD